jgi:hypothetical protein
MQQTVWNVHKGMENIGVMESVNGILALNNVNSKKVLITKNNFDKSVKFFDLQRGVG